VINETEQSIEAQMSDTHELETTLEDLREIVARKNAAIKLESNREYKKLILDGLFKEEASRLVAISAEPSMAREADLIMESIRSISHFQQYMRSVIQMGTIAENNLAEHMEMLEEVRAEEAANEDEAA
jgi:hypothetical protein